MKTQAAVLWEIGSPYKIETIDLKGPNPYEVTVELAASGLCHSDDHTVTGDVPCPLPIIGGHEGAGVVTEVGSEVVGLKKGDHVLLHPVPNCGKCRWCVTGRANLCDMNAFALTGHAPDGAFRRELDGVGIGAYCQLGTFSPVTTVSQTQVVKIDSDIPLDVAALIGCGVTTGVGAATKVGKVQPGDVVVVIGVGGVGMNAVQGARIAGASTIIAIDPKPFRREQSTKFGAHLTFESISAAEEPLRELTRGVMADVVIVTVGVMHGDLLTPTMGLVSKGGTCVLTSVTPIAEATADVNLFDLAMSNKQIRGHVFGEANPREDFRRLISMYRAGDLLLDDLITNRYSLDAINDGYAAMHDGTNVRGVITY